MYKHIIDRSNLDASVSYNPRTKEHTTLRQELERSEIWLRCDIVLFNGTRSHKQYVLYVTATGFAGHHFILDMLDDAEYEKVQGIAQRMRENATNFPPAQRLLVASEETA